MTVRLFLTWAAAALGLVVGGAPALGQVRVTPNARAPASGVLIGADPEAPPGNGPPAQPAGDPPAWLPPPWNSATIQRLQAPAAYTEGNIYPPCASPGPVITSTNFRGTFRLIPQPVATNDTFRTFAVREVNWLVTDPGGVERWFTGAGVYRLRLPHPASATPLAPMQQLQLTLDLGAGVVVTFDSGLVPAPQPFTGIDLTVRSAYQGCFGRSIRVVSKVVPAAEVRRYLLNNSSAFLEGCGPACDCPLLMRPLVGNYAMIPLPPPPGPTAVIPVVTEYAVTPATFVIGGSSAVGRLAIGYGFYRWVTVNVPPDPAHPEDSTRQRMQLRVAFASATPTPANSAAVFDSGWVFRTAPFPGVVNIPIVNPPPSDTPPCMMQQFDIRSNLVSTGGGG